MINFKEKGFAFERKIARQFGIWWADDPKSLYRNTSSGARATKVGSGLYAGDIVPANDTVKYWPFCIELKKSEQFSVGNFINGNPGEPLLYYMIQALEAAETGCNGTAMLICAKKYKKPLCFLDRYSFYFARKSFEDRCLGTLRWVKPLKISVKRAHPIINFYILYLEDFFKLDRTIFQ